MVAYSLPSPVSLWLSRRSVIVGAHLAVGRVSAHYWTYSMEFLTHVAFIACLETHISGRAKKKCLADVPPACPRYDHILFTLPCASSRLSPLAGPDQNHPKPIHVGLGRLQGGQGVSALRSVITHGLLWAHDSLKCRLTGIFAVAGSGCELCLIENK